MQITKYINSDLNDLRLDVAATKIFKEYSRTQIKNWILNGCLLVNGDVSKPKDLVQENDEIELNPIVKDKISWEPQNINFQTVFECEDYLIINKPINLVMHPGAGCHDKTLANGLLYKHPELSKLPRCGIVHRLDKDTSGILVVAKTDKFRNHFIKEMQARNIVKKYFAVVAGINLSSLKINDPIGRDKKNRTKMCVREDGKEALTIVNVKETIGNYSILHLTIMTGRTHQIRVHLSSKKLPIIGDKTYNPSGQISKGSSLELIKVIRAFPRQALHAEYISFKCPKSGEDLSYKVFIPDDIKSLIQNMKNCL